MSFDQQLFKVQHHQWVPSFKIKLYFLFEVIITLAFFPTIHSVILATMSVNRPTRNGTFIHFKDSTTNTIVRSYDCGWAPEVTYTGFTIIVRIPLPTPWIPGHNYYVMFDSGSYFVDL